MTGASWWNLKNMVFHPLMTSKVQNQFFGCFVCCTTPPILEIFFAVEDENLPLCIGKDLQVSIRKKIFRWSCYSGTTCSVKCQNGFFEGSPYSTWSDVPKWGIILTLILLLIIPNPWTWIKGGGASLAGPPKSAKSGFDGWHHLQQWCTRSQ